ncbi:MAG: alpha/beta hydrolase [Acidimicrobiia bacterium]
MDQLELTVGEYTFTARADGPDDADLVLLLHGFPETSWEWRAQLPALATAGYRAVAPDQRGYAEGARPSAVEEYSVVKLAADTVGFADTLGAERFHVVGHDWGGAVAWVCAALYPDRVRTLTSVSTPHPTAMRKSILEGEQREKSAYMDVFRAEGAEDLFLGNDAEVMRSTFESFGFDAETIDEYMRVLRGPGAMTGGLNWYRANDFAASGDFALPPITVPTMYVWPDADEYLGREAAEATAEYVDGPYRFEVLEGVSHWAPEEAAVALNALLVDHLRSG